MFLEVHLNKDTAILNMQFLVKKKKKVVQAVVWAFISY